jgi:Carboxypeptidase regulatory-like domain/TonB-dependent Receptor Plug Domain
MLFRSTYARLLVALLPLLVFFPSHAFPQSTSGTITGTVTDPSGAVVPNAIVEIVNPVSGYQRTATTGANGQFQFPNLPFNAYHLTAKASGFGEVARDAEVRSPIAVEVKIPLEVEGSATSVTVNAEDLLENDTTMHTDLDRKSFARLPLESQSSSVSSLVTLSSPGVAADSNGLFHGLGDHAENSFSVDGQPITDQQSKVFSNQIPASSIQSIEVIDGAPPAEYGDKTSLVINVTTRSGQGITTPTGSIVSSYGTFGSSTAALDLSYGGQNWGNFVSLDGLNTSRFLDAPEFKVFHDKGNEQNFFDRLDYTLSPKDSLHLNLNYTRSWFQTPNTYDNLNIGVTDPVNNNPVGATDQRSKIETFDIAPSYTRLTSANTVFNFGAFVRKDTYNYYPSGNPFADLGPIQSETVSQLRTLLNTGVRSDLSYIHGIHNFKMGGVYQQTFLTENDNLGIVTPTLNAPCQDANGAPLSGFTDPSQCAAAGDQPNPSFNPVLLPYDLTRGGSNYPFRGHTDVKELALYAQDQITNGNWLFNLGIRGDFYNGLVTQKQPEPRVGVGYSVKPTNTVLRVSYARVLETPFNENLVVSSIGAQNPVISGLVPSAPGRLEPGFRNEFHAGFQQAIGSYVVISAEYLWKYTHNAYDFSVLGNTPITFPINWHNSKISGPVARISVPNFHNFSAFVVLSSVNARFFPPQVGGLGVTVGQSGLPFRIDHDERFNQTTHLQYQPWKRGPWMGFNWRYDSGLVAGAVPFATDTTTPVDLTGLTADQQFEAGLFCGSQKATLTTPLTTCAPSLYGSTLLKIPAPGTENDDHNPPRVAPRSLFDATVGEDNLFNGERYKWSLRFTAINLTNKYALYNFLSTFSGTHYVTPRALTAEVGFHF